MITLLALTPQLHGILVGGLVIAILLLVLAGLIWLVQRFISPLPPIVLLILAIAVLVCIVIWVMGQLGINL